MEHFGLVGHPNAGKSSLFNVLTGSKILAAPYPFATIDPNVGVAIVPDRRLDDLAAMSQSKNVVPASVHFTDIGGLVEGASEGEGLGNQFLSAIREGDAIVFVLRAFESKDLPEPMPLVEQLEILEVELSLADLESGEKQLEKRQRKAKAEKFDDETTAALTQAVELLKKGCPVYKSDLSEEERLALRPCNLLTNKPVMAVINISESDVGSLATEREQKSSPENESEIENENNATAHDSKETKNTPDNLKEVKEVATALAGGEVISVCVGLEVEAVDFSPAERKALFEDMGIKQDALSSFLQSAYRLLGLSTFFTTGEKESRAWTFETGSTAPECAGKIHTDMERGFIRADCIPAEELISLGSIQAAKEAGKVAGVGRDYLVQDGDTLEIRFNV